jgi:hypothetical protein
MSRHQIGIVKKTEYAKSRPGPTGTSRISDAQVLLAAVSLLALSVGSVAQTPSAPQPGSASTSNQLKTNSNQIKVQAEGRVLPSNQLKKALPTAGTPATNPPRGKPVKPGKKKPKLRLTR